MKIVFALSALALAAAPAWAGNLQVLPAGCGTGAFGNGAYAGTMDPQGRGCVAGGATSPGGSAATPSYTAPGTLVLVPLDVATVTTGGTAVTALTAGHRLKGGFIQNPTGAMALCINEIGAASGATSAGSTTCIGGGQSYAIAPAAGAVSVISADGAHAFSGMGLN